MHTKNLTKITLTLVVALLLGSVGTAQNSNAQPHCKQIGGTVMTNLGVEKYLPLSMQKAAAKQD